MWTPLDRIEEPLYVITSLFNPIRYKSRWKLYERFVQHVTDAGAKLVTVEAAFGERAFVAPHVDDRAPRPRDHQHVQVRTSHELWLKENMLNIGVSRLPHDWKYVAFVDADVFFSRPNWVTETIHALQHYSVVQMFSEAVDLGPEHEIIGKHRGFAWCHLNGVEPPPAHTYYGAIKADGIHKWHPGWAWAFRRDAFDHLGGLIDFAILGAADNHMAKALIHTAADSIHPAVHPNYRKMVLEWEKRADKHIRQNIGYVSGLLQHGFHGPKGNRGYWSRWKILTDNKFDPETDIKRDWQNLYQLTDKNFKLRDGVREYFRSRNEDSLEI